MFWCGDGFGAGWVADPDRSWVALGTFSRTQKPGHAHRKALGVLIKKMPVPRFQLYFFSPKPRFYFCELLWFWKWRRFLNFYPMKTISSRKSEVKSQVGHSQIRNELIEASPTSHRNLCFGVANSEIQLRAQNSLSGSAARRPCHQHSQVRKGTVNACRGTCRHSCDGVAC